MARLVTAFLAALLSTVLWTGLLWTRRTQRHPNNALFTKGRVPDPLPDGPYRGSAPRYDGVWKGKAFDRAAAAGINLFDDWDHPRKAFPFSMAVGPGLQDRDVTVLKIDYDRPDNPLWLRRILDEVVEVEPGRLLGKVHLRLIPLLPFTVAYFWLDAPQRNA